MLDKEQIERLNELAKKKKEEGLTDEETLEQEQLRKAYLKSFRSGMRNHIEGLKVVDKEGKDVTPDKLKQIQAEKGLHGRNQEE
ncbi:DUF896 family protein [Granulicatella seriolae]|uniref:UPF0291 protein NPA36_00280 n=1 Tax=Granulicatella seriolae TaxID=2967226 RepID=A0ABT1WK72_9LACT|nr:DUF896 family protein [Granulicatella seriolae]